jgi:hypothetical protein
VGMCFSTDGRRLASSGGLGRVKVWDSTSGQELLTLKGHTGEVLEVCFSPDSTRLWTETARPWEPARRQCGFGTQPAAWSSSPSSGTPAGFGPCASAPTAGGWPRLVASLISRMR